MLGANSIILEHYPDQIGIVGKDIYFGKIRLMFTHKESQDLSYKEKLCVFIFDICYVLILSSASLSCNFYATLSFWQVDLFPVICREICSYSITSTVSHILLIYYIRGRQQ